MTDRRLRDEVRPLLTAACHAHTAMTFDVSSDTKRIAVENLRLAIERIDKLVAQAEAEDRVDAPADPRAR